jgi:polysaccharide biosynthesis transport protein
MCILSDRAPDGDEVCPEQNAAYKSMSSGQGNQISQATRIMPQARPAIRAAVQQDDLFQVLWRGKWIMLFTSMIGLACTYLYLENQVKVPFYRSEAAILIEKPYSFDGSNVPQPVGGSASNYLQTHVSMMKSRTIINAALNDPEVITLPSLTDVNNPAAYLHEALSVSLAKDTDILIITAETPYPENSAKIVNAVIKAYIHWHETNKQITTTDLLKDLNQQLNKRQKELTSKRNALAVSEKNMLIQSKGSMSSEQLDKIQQDLEQARMSEIRLDSYYKGLLRFQNEPDNFRQYMNSKEGLIPSTVQQDDRGRIERELDAIRMQLADHEAREEPARHSDAELYRKEARRLEEKIVHLDAQISRLDRKFIKQHMFVTKSLLEDTRLQIKQLQDTYEEKFSGAIRRSNWNSEHSRLVSECQMSESMCNSLLDQIDQLDLGSNLQSLNIHVLEKALPSSVPVPFDNIRPYALGLIMGLMSGAGLTALREMNDKRIRSADEIDGILGLPILGTVPHIKKYGFVARSQRLRFASRSSESEAYRSIRTSILFGAPGERRPTTILVTSPAASEGRTTQVSNLGIALAQSGQRSLILDADLRKPKQQRIFMKKGNGYGLADVLTGAATLEDAIRSTETQGLDVLANGKKPLNPSELLNSPVFGDVLHRLRNEYDHILIDSPAVGLVTDAQIVATFCDMTLLVLKAEKSTRPRALRARDALFSVGARSLGCIVNDVPKNNHRFNNYGGYGHYSQLAANSPTDGSTRKRKRAKLLASSLGDSEVSNKSKRRYFTPAYKASIVEKAMNCTEPGQINALLEQEGLHSSSLAKWRKQYRAGALTASPDDEPSRRVERT